jgi:outer membrane protein insertion porin family
VAVFEGDQPDDKGVLYVIDEVPRQRILETRFEGNTFAAGRLQTIVKSKPGVLACFGSLSRKQLDEDINRLTAYYRFLGFFQVKVGREMEFNDENDRLTVTFVINEGPRYKVRKVAVLGNTKFSAEELTKKLKLAPNKFFSQQEMNEDVALMRAMYRSAGHVFADVEADLRLAEETGVFDLVYTIKEENRDRVVGTAILALPALPAVQERPKGP